MADKTDVLQFMVIRPPELPGSDASKTYIRDDSLEEIGPRDADLFSTETRSAIGRMVYAQVFCSDGDIQVSNIVYNRNTLILLQVLQSLEQYQPPCPNSWRANGVTLESVAGRSYVKTANSFFFLPDRVADIDTPLAPSLLEIMAIARQHAAVENPEDLQLDSLVKEIRTLLNTSELRTAVFNGARTSDNFRDAKRRLFDALYVLYILRRRFSVSLEQIIEGLRALHMIEALAIDEFLEKLRQQGQIDAADRPLFNALAVKHNVLKPWKANMPLPRGLPLVKGLGDLVAYLDASPVVHPIFSQLYYYRRPFNPIRPIGVGDLKVVKQWLKSYKVGEIAHIDNVLQGETKTRVHRRLEKTEEVFSFSSEEEQETQSDVQTTDRFEMKRETDNVLKTDTSVNAGLSLNITYEGTGYRILSGVTGGFAYSRSQSDQSKTSTNFAREVVDKAVKRVQSRTSQQRSTTKLFETEETNTHTFENKPPSPGHISGIYRWIDKEYEAQVHNYGKRMMFEFVIPEPASFLVESRLRAFESRIDFPRPPKPPRSVALPEWLQTMSASSINEARFRQLAQHYDLSDLPQFPAPAKAFNLIDVKTGNALFAETVKDGNATYSTRTFNCKLDGAKGYRIAKLLLRGHVIFAGYQLPLGSFPPATQDDLVPFVLGPAQRNQFEVIVAGDILFSLTDNTSGAWHFTSGQLATSFNVPNARTITSEDVNIVLGFWDIDRFAVNLGLELTIAPDTLAVWQDAVRRKILQIEQSKADEKNRELTQAYNTAMATYRNRLAELRATAVNDLLQGQSEAANRQVVLLELKRQCLAMLTKEFDAIQTDDQLTDYDAMGVRDIDVLSRQFRVVETPDDFPVTVSGGFEEVSKEIPVRMIDIDKARIKGRYVQFLEQAFEWQLLSYFLYPYFWSTPPHWVELMNRSDQADPFLTSFLQAGSVRVLIAVTPAYDEAVLHYLATGEPWEGGPSPVIGDPLFIPLYEELKRQQDDRLNAKPEGKPWQFTLPTSLVYLEKSSTPIPRIT